MFLQKNACEHSNSYDFFCPSFNFGLMVKFNDWNFCHQREKHLDGPDPSNVLGTVGCINESSRSAPRTGKQIWSRLDIRHLASPEESHTPDRRFDAEDSVHAARTRSRFSSIPQSRNCSDQVLDPRRGDQGKTLFDIALNYNLTIRKHYFISNIAK